MAKKSKGKLSTKNKRRPSTRRRERRFVSQGSSNAPLVKVLGALAALVLGAGAWAYVYGQSFAADESLRQLPSYLIAGGAVLFGIVIWLGTSADPPVRVGAPGIAVEKGDLRRMPWWGVERIQLDQDALALVVTGKDEAGVDWTFKLPLKTHAEAIGWLVKEALDRIPRRLDVDEATLEKLPGAGEHAGQALELEPLQVVGKRCAATSKIISYEPDARVCTRCERVYVKTAVPKKCKCGNAMAHLRAEDTDEDTSEAGDEDEAAGGDEELPSEKVQAAEG